MPGDQQTDNQPNSSSRPAWLAAASIATRLLVVLLLIAVPAGIFAALRASKPVPPKASQDVAAPTVRVLEVQPRPVQRSWVGYGQARAMDAVNVPALVSAKVINRPEIIEDGVWVEAGDLLLELDPEDFGNQLAASKQRIAALQAQIDGLQIEERRLSEQAELARTEVDLARRELERVRQAVSQRAGTTTDIEIRQTTLSRAERVLAGLEQQADLIPTRRASLAAQIEAEQATLANAQLQVDRSTISAPIAGFIQSIEPEAGEFVPAGTIVARLIDPRRLEIPLRVPASAVSSLNVGDRVELQVDGPAGATAMGNVSRIAPEAEAATRSASVFVELAQPFEASRGQGLASAGGIVLPGQVVVGRLVSSDTEPRIIVPRRVVADDRVLIVREQPDDNGGSITRVQRADVRVLYSIQLEPDNEVLSGETQWVVLGAGGVEPGDRVVVSSLDELQSDNNAATVTSLLPRGRRVVPIDAREAEASSTRASATDGKTIGNTIINSDGGTRQ